MPVNAGRKKDESVGLGKCDSEKGNANLDFYLYYRAQFCCLSPSDVFSHRLRSMHVIV